jgi:hypothetical protein
MDSNLKQKKLSNHILTTNDVLTNVNFKNILKSNLGYRELNQIKKSPNYLNHFSKKNFAIIKQFGPSTFFMTFTMGVNNWPILIKTLKDLHIKQFNQKGKINFDYSLNNRNIVRNGPITFV